MSEKIYMYLLIFCGILCQGIIAIRENTGKSSDFLVRKRRVINHLPGRSAVTPIDEANYIVIIKESNRATCAGVILSHYTVLTAALCVPLRIQFYRVFAGSGFDHRSHIHTTQSKEVLYSGLPHQYFDGVALITVDPPFVYNRKTGYIPLYAGPLPAGTQVNVFGWGCIYPPLPQMENRRRLRTITLPIMSHGECENTYRHNFNATNITHRYVIKDSYICTYHAQQYCAHSDAGAPLVFNNMLAGIHIWKGEFADRRNPDVFINLQDQSINAWIRQKTVLM